MPQHAQADRSAPVARLTTLERDGGQRIALRLEGAWRLPVLPRIDEGLRSLALPPTVIIDGSDLTEIDSAAALTLLRRLGRAGIDPLRVRLVDFTPGCLRIIEQVRAHLGEIEARRITHRAGSLESLGRRVVAWKDNVAGYLNFIGAVAVRTARTVIHPRSLRVKELAVQFERVCIEAIGVVSLVTLLIGVVITYLLGIQAAKYGATAFVVDGVGIGVTREFAPILVAAVMAGRSGAAFTAQLGSMRLTEETDAIRTLGLSPLDVLVLPRMFALILAMPLLVFVGDVMSLVGASLVANGLLGILPVTFLERLRTLNPNHLYVGLTKAPVLGIVIAIIGCRMGMTVGRDTRAVGKATTSTVVLSLVWIILLDAGFAVFFQVLDI